MRQSHVAHIGLHSVPWVAEGGLELLILLSPLSQCRDSRCGPPYLHSFLNFLVRIKIMGFTMAVSCMDASLYNKWLCLLISLFALSSAFLSHLFYGPVLLLFPFPLNLFLLFQSSLCACVCHVLCVCACVNSHPGSAQDTVGISESRWFFSIVLAHSDVVASRKCARAVRTSSLWCGGL